MEAHMVLQGISYKISWKIITYASSHKLTLKQCKLCILEKYYYIMCKPFLF